MEAPDANRNHLDVALREANLLRLRGDFGAARTRALSALAQSPDDLTTLQLLAEIARDDSRPEEAARWLALAGVRHGTESGPPDRRGKRWMTPLAAAVVLLLMIGAAYQAGRGLTPAPAPIHDRVVAPRPIVADAPVRGPSFPDVPPAVSSSLLTTEEASALAALQRAGDAGRPVIGYQRDPHSGEILLTVAVPPGDSPRTVCSEAVRLLFAETRAADTVRVRALRDGAVIFAASTARAQFESATPEASPFTNEWPDAAPVGNTRP